MFASLLVCDFRGLLSNKHDDFCFILEVFMKQLLLANLAG